MDYQPEGVLVAHSVEEALRLAGDVEELVIVGGGEVYRAFLPLVNRLYLTFVKDEFSGTAYFPERIPTLQGFTWRETHREQHFADEKNPVDHCYLVQDRFVVGGEPGGPLDIRSLIALQSGRS